MNYHLLSQVVGELDLLIAKARLERIVQGADRGIYFLFRKERKNYVLLISPLRTLPRMHLVGEKPGSATDVHPFVLSLRSRLPGSRLDHVVLLNHDRVVEMQFAADTRVFTLIFELTGSSANLFFCEDRRILSLYYPVPISEHARRTLLPGVEYAPPLKKQQALPIEPFRDSDASRPPNSSAESYYEHFVEERERIALRSELRSVVRKARVKTERRRDALLADLEEARECESFRAKGDLILAHLQKLKTGNEVVDLTGYDGVRVSVHLDPKLTPAKNAELYFKKYKKAKAGLPLITSRMRQAEEELSGLGAMLSAIEGAQDRNTLLTIKSVLIDRGHVKSTLVAPGKKRDSPLSGIKRVLYHGWEIFIGRNAAGNDLLTTRLAKPDDLWLHAEGLPGSHVLVRNTGRKEIPPPILIAAASLAALYSKGRGSGKVPVTYCEARYVRKPKGAKPGLVTLSRRKTVLVEPIDLSTR